MEKQKKKLSKVKRIILWVLVVLIAVLAIALISFMAFLDGIVATAIRQVGPALTGTEVKVSDVTISLMDGRARISGFVVGNPDGYSTPEAMKFDEFFVDINLTSMLGGEELIINEIYIKSPRISLETSIYRSTWNRLLRRRKAERQKRSRRKLRNRLKPAKRWLSASWSSKMPRWFWPTRSWGRTFP